jgi:hypothetical protein
METVKKVYFVDRKEINYLRVIIESYDGMGIVRTIDPNRALIEIEISPGCEKIFSMLLKSLKEEENIKLELFPKMSKINT